MRMTVYDLQRMLAVLCTISGAWAQEQAANTGRVVDQDGKPIADAMVTYLDPELRLDVAYTGIDGQFTIASTLPATGSAASRPGKMIREGLDTLRIGKTGYRPALLPISSYGEQVAAPIRLEVLDVEGMVAATLAKHRDDPAWLIGQVTGGLQDIPDADFAASRLGAIFAPLEQTQPTADAWADQVDAKQRAATAAGIPPLLVGGLVVHGWTYRMLPAALDRTPRPYTQDETRKLGRNGIVFPHNSGLGCMNDPALLEQAYRVMALEARGAGINWTLSPFVEAVRDIRSGRTFESFSADPATAAKLSAAAIRGLQGTDLSSPRVIAATAKYFLGAGGTVQGTTWGDAASASEAVMQSLFLPSYRAAIEAGVAGILVDGHSWAGKPMWERRDLLTDLLKEQLRFDGMVVADWNDGGNPTPDPARDPAAPAFPNPWTAAAMPAAAGYVANGMDVNSAGPLHRESIAALQHAVADGTVSQERLTDAARRILRIKARMGLLDGGPPLVDRELTHAIGSPAHQEVARRCVRESLVLLKNDGILPLKRSQRILIAGKAGGIEGLTCGGYTRIGRQGDNGRFKDPMWTSIAKGFKERMDKAAGGLVIQQETIEGRSAWTDPQRIKASADVIVAVLYECSYADRNGDAGGRIALETGYYGGSQTTIDSFTRSSMMQTLLACHGTVPLVTLIISGRPQVLPREIIDASSAVVMAWLPGSECEGIADVLLGDYDFQGTLSFPWPASSGQLPLHAGDLGDATGTRGAPLFPIGFGLRYRPRP